jgi:hypothetical protein
MKATFNGITVEGTPQEIMEYQQLQAEKAHMKPMAPHPFDQAKYFRDIVDAAKKQQYADSGSMKTPDYLQWPHIICMNTTWE